MIRRLLIVLSLLSTNALNAALAQAPAVTVTRFTAPAPKDGEPGFDWRAVQNSLAGKQRAADEARAAAVGKARAECDARFYHATKATPNPIRTRGEYEACRSAAHDVVPASQAARGSDRFAQSRYAKLSPRQAEDALAHLRSEWEASVKAGLGKRDPGPGEATPAQLEAEAWWIHHHLYGESGKVAGTPWYVPCGGAVDDMTWAAQLPGDRQPCPLGSHGQRAGR